MSFDLRIEFSGLCVYVMHPDTNQLAVLMPDAREGTANPVHADGTRGVAHVGYIRFNLANLVQGIPAGDAETGPAYEVVHRFDRETLDLGLPPTNMPIDSAPELPDFGRFAPSLQLIRGALDKTPPTELLMRMLLRGGTISSAGEQKDWRFSDTLNRGGPEYSGQFTSVVKWSQRIHADGMTVTLRSFEGGKHIRVPLKPTPGEHGLPVIDLKIANLCSQNPLEWPELELRIVTGDDLDFKWLYRLHAAPGEPLPRKLNGNPLPVPLQPTVQTYGIQDCLGGRQTLAFDASVFDG